MDGLLAANKEYFEAHGSHFSLPTCLIFLRNLLRRTLESASNTWRNLPRSASFLSSSSELPEERKMVLITPILTQPVFTLSQKKYGTHTNSSVRFQMPCSPVPLPSEMFTEFTHLEMLI